MSSEGANLILKELSSDYLFNKRSTVLFGHFIQKLWAFPSFLRCKSGPVKVHDTMLKEFLNISRNTQNITGYLKML